MDTEKRNQRFTLENVFNVKGRGMWQSPDCLEYN